MPEPIRVVLVDDEAPARSLLREYLGAHADVRVVGECANGFEAVKKIPDLAPHIVFLDVQMPKLDGFEVLELLEPDPATGRTPAVIFCTAYDEYALRAFEVHAVDYLLKPFGRERLAEALDRARERLAMAGRPAPGGGDATPSDAGAAPAPAATASPWPAPSRAARSPRSRSRSPARTRRRERRHHR